MYSYTLTPTLTFSFLLLASLNVHYYPTRTLTDDHDVVGYWEDITSSLTVRVDMLNSFIAEAKAIKNNKSNKWLTYGLPLHRMRGRDLSFRPFNRQCHNIFQSFFLKSLFLLLRSRSYSNALYSQSIVITFFWFIPLLFCLFKEFGITVKDWEWDLDSELNPKQLTTFFAFL